MAIRPSLEVIILSLEGGCQEYCNRRTAGFQVGLEETRALFSETVGNELIDISRIE
jgi:hypothetical protein